MEYDIWLDEPLRNIGDICDELNITDGKVSVIRRIGVDEELNLYVLDIENVQELENIRLKTFDKDTYIYIREYEFLKYYCKYITDNDYVDIFATQGELDDAVTELYSSITQTAEDITVEVNKKVGNDELGTKITQNAESVQMAWNKISENIQFEVIDENPVISIRNDNNNLLMTIDKTGQHFFDNSGNLIGDIGTIDDEDRAYLAFQLPLEFDDGLDNGMAWGVKTPVGFFPIFELIGYHIISDSDDIGGELAMRSALNMENNPIYMGNTIIDSDVISNTIYLNLVDNLILTSSSEETIVSILPSSETVFNLLDMLLIYINKTKTEYVLSFGTTEEAVRLTTGGGIHCQYLIERSLETYKKNFEKLDNGLNIIKSTEIYKYNLNTQKDKEKKHIGFVIGANYNYSSDITAEDENGNEIGVDLYSMISVAYKAIQEQQEQIEKLQDEINKLKEVK